ncbi:hypothetical protein V500_06706, partial [Pseudogymnoascus sp. VKM F-4518 (FW-2643)]
SPKHVRPLRRSPPESASTQSPTSQRQSPASPPPKRSPHTPDPHHTSWPSAKALKPQPLSPAVRGVQRNLRLEISTRTLQREAILQRLGKHFPARSSAAGTAGQLQDEVRLNMMTGGAGVKAIGDETGMGMAMQNGMMVPLMIFR